MIKISTRLKEFLQENRELIADGEILELYKKMYKETPTYIRRPVGELTDLLLDSGVDIWDYFTEGIPRSAFVGSTIKNLEIPNSVTTIGDYAFEDCSNLTSIAIPDSVAYIGPSAFHNCKSLTSVTIGNSVTRIDAYAFQNCKSLTNVTIGNSVVGIGAEAFGECSSLTSVIIPNSVVSISFGAFSYCSSLTSMTVGKGVMSIGDSTFYGCVSLTSITYGGTREQWEKIKKIGRWNFSSALKTIKCVDGDINL